MSHSHFSRLPSIANRERRDPVPTVSVSVPLHCSICSKTAIALLPRLLYDLINSRYCLTDFLNNHMIYQDKMDYPYLLNTHKKFFAPVLLGGTGQNGRGLARRLYSRDVFAHVMIMPVRKSLAQPASSRVPPVSGDTTHPTQDLARDRSDTQRLAWLDAAKGVGIILVVYGHQLRAQMASGKIDPSWCASLQDSMIYAFHMPLFFFISGLTIERTFNKITGWQFVRSRLATLMYPYLLWSLVSLGLALAGHRYVNHQMNFGDVVTIVWKPVFQYWFLYALFVSQLVAFCVGMRHAIIALIAIAALVFPFDAQNPVLIDTMVSFPFFAAGILLSSRVLKSVDGCSLKSMVACGVVSAAAFLAMFFFRGAPLLSTPPFKFLLASCGIAAVIAFSVAIGGRSRLLVLLGATSMAIFVLHTIVQTAIRSGLNLLPWFDANIIQLACCVVGGLAIPLGIQRTVAIVGLERQLGLGSPPKGRTQ